MERQSHSLPSAQQLRNPVELTAGTNPQDLINLQSYGLAPNVMLSAFSTVQSNYSPLQSPFPAQGAISFNTVVPPLQYSGIAFDAI
ncbi:unnamed protein product [Strongylus vulgaris]|uniref:Uncharacterized protein n=1 Tax=Strongylus vulgaris TaxID=40348 RepID=A0A3P7LRB5_STRVU|nr:unnamed protein product [Strongylus vulgaris]